MSAYWDVHFFSFFLLFFQRLPLLLKGKEAFCSDEVQLIVISAVAFSCGLVSPLLILQRMTMLANSLSHTVLLGIALSALVARAFWGGQWFDMSSLLLGAFIAAVLTALSSDALAKWFRLQADASIGLVFTGLFAIAIMIVTIYLRDVHLGVEAIMGNADALSISDVALPACSIVVNAAIIFLFFKQFQLLSFDTSLARIFGVNVGFFRYLFLLLVAITCIGAFRAVGVVVVLTLLTGPYLMARLFCSRLSGLLVLTPLIGMGASWISVAISRHVFNIHGWALSTGGIVSVVIGLLYFLALLVKKLTTTKKLHRETEIC